jgi:hypothetical protein
LPPPNAQLIENQWAAILVARLQDNWTQISPWITRADFFNEWFKTAFFASIRKKQRNAVF